jgi:hypothetical protein
LADLVFGHLKRESNPILGVDWESAFDYPMEERIPHEDLVGRELNE